MGFSFDRRVVVVVSPFPSPIFFIFSLLLFLAVASQPDAAHSSFQNLRLVIVDGVNYVQVRW